MGYGCYNIGNGRFGGYGVPAVCEDPGCNKEIDRGMSCACGGEPFSEGLCDRYFCAKHTYAIAFNKEGEKIEDYKKEDEKDYEFKFGCERCKDNKPPFDYKDESKEWLEHVINDESWNTWREKNPKILLKYKKQLCKKDN